MSSNRRRFNDKIHVRSTKYGTQSVRPSDIVTSEEARREMRLLRETFTHAKNGSVAHSKKTANASKK